MRLFSLLVVFLLTIPAASRAQSANVESALRLSLSFGAHFGGQANARTRLDSPIGEVSETLSFDLVGAPSLALRVVKPLHRFFSIGGAVRYTAWKIERADDRNHALDLSALPAFRYAFAIGGKGLTLEPHLTVPVGLTLNISPAGEDRQTNAGMHFGLLAGATIFLTPRIGIFGELGFINRRVWDRNGEDELTLSTRLAFTQAVFDVGATVLF